MLTSCLVLISFSHLLLALLIINVETVFFMLVGAVLFCFFSFCSAYMLHFAELCKSFVEKKIIFIEEVLELLLMVV